MASRKSLTNILSGSKLLFVNSRAAFAFPDKRNLITLTTSNYKSYCLQRYSVPLTNIKMTTRFYTTSSKMMQSANSDSEANSPKRKLPATMDFPHITWPSLFKTVRNWILSTLVITPYFDPEFSLREFIQGSTQAFVVVANKLANSRFDELKGLVDPDALKELQNNISSFSDEDRLSLAVNIEDVYLSFPYQVGVMFDDKQDGTQERFVEITMCYHVFRGLAELQKREDFQLGPASIQQYRDRIMVCNYRFIREFTKGVQDSWTINVASHFRPADDAY